jgi:hypothetical protein
MGEVRCISCACCHGRGFVNNVEIYFVSSLAWTKYVEIHVESSLAFEGFGEQKLRCWHGRVLVKKC